MNNQSMTDVMNSLTGYDEIAIAKAFGHDITVLMPTEEDPGKPLTMTRALYFVLQRREGLNDKDAKHAAMEQTVGELDIFFADDEDDAAGEDDSPPA